MHCVHSHTRCIIRLSVNTEPIVSPFAMHVIGPKARSKTDPLDASSKTDKIPASRVSMLWKCLKLIPFWRTRGEVSQTVQGRMPGQTCRNDPFRFSLGGFGKGET
jgi:hypothetical protein